MFGSAFAPVIDALPQQQMRFSSNTDIFSQGVVPLLTIFRTIGPLWDGNTPDCSRSNNMKFPYVSNRLVMMQRKKKKKGRRESLNVTTALRETVIAFGY